MTEKIDYIVNNLVKYDFTLEDLKEIAPVIESMEFETLYENTEDMHAVFQELGKIQLKEDLKEMVTIENRKLKLGKLIQLKNHRLQSIAAAVLVVCVLGVFKVTNNNYNNQDNFRKSYIQK